MHVFMLGESRSCSVTASHCQQQSSPDTKAYCMHYYPMGYWSNYNVTMCMLHALTVIKAANQNAALHTRTASPDAVENFKMKIQLPHSRSGGGA